MRLFGDERRQPRVHALRGAGGQVRVEAVRAGEVRQFPAERGPVGGPVEGPVERPPAAADHLDQRPHGRQVRPARRRQEPQDELVGALRPQRRGRGAQRVHVARREAVGGAQHHPQRDVDGRPDRGERGARRRQPVRGHVRDEFQAVGTAGLRGHRVLGTERDHLQERALIHTTQPSDGERRGQSVRGGRRGRRRTRVPRPVAPPPLPYRSSPIPSLSARRPRRRHPVRDAAEIHSWPLPYRHPETTR
ncbi:hypothetical protein P354_11905 [Streptomyces noursei PD-1]|nr:hypothetical protein P354_11905 [Streptomyces noursei PD-1]